MSEIIIRIKLPDDDELLDEAKTEEFKNGFADVYDLPVENVTIEVKEEK